MVKTILSIFLALFLLQTSLLAQTQFFVAPNGKNTHPGTKNKPFRSIAQAVLEARKIQGPVSIYLRAGTYHLAQPIVFTTADARKQEAPLLIKNFENEPVTISGGTSWTV